jgi:uncharacterized RDD family membrane protein YckC
MDIARRRIRFTAWMLDWVIATVLVTPFNPVIYYSSAPDFWVAATLGAAGLAAAFVYFVMFDGGERGATPGKRILGIRVGDEVTGRAIGHRRAVVHRLGYVLGGWRTRLSSGRANGARS